MHKKITIIIMLLFVCICSHSLAIENQNIKYKNNNTNYEALIEDDAELLSEEEEELLVTKMKDLTEYGNIVFKTISRNSYGSTSQYASNYYHSKYGKESGTVFLIDMSKRMIYIFSDGKNYSIITKSKAEVITDNIYKYASKKEYYTCAEEAFSQIETLLNGGKIAEPMKYVSNAIVAFMLALFTNFAIYKVITKNRAAGNNEQIRECEFYANFTTPQVVPTGEHSVYSPIERSSGSSGGSSGGGSSSGGGGGHSF